MISPMSSRNDGFLLDFARIFVYSTAISQDIKAADVFMALFEADVHMYDPIAKASRNDDTPWYARKTLTDGDMRVSDATTPCQSRRDPMTSVPHLFVPSLTGCVLVASVVFGCPAVSDALARPVADGPLSATAGTQPLPPSRVQIGLASWYGRRWQGRPTASGERYDWHQPTAAHRTAPLA